MFTLFRLSGSDENLSTQVERAASQAQSSTYGAEDGDDKVQAGWLAILRGMFRGTDEQDAMLAKLEVRRNAAKQQLTEYIDNSTPEGQGILARQTRLDSNIDHAVAAVWSARSRGKIHKGAKWMDVSNKRTSALIKHAHTSIGDQKTRALKLEHVLQRQGKANTSLSGPTDSGIQRSSSSQPNRDSLHPVCEKDENYPATGAEPGASKRSSTEPNISTIAARGAICFTTENEKTFLGLVYGRATYNHRDTRKVLFPAPQMKSIHNSLRDITGWFEKAFKSDSTRVYWLWQDRDDGGDNVLRAVANVCGKDVASSFFCREAKQRDIRSKFVCTLTYELAQYSYAFGRMMLVAWNRDSHWIMEKAIPDQMERLFLKPLQEMPAEDRRHPFLIIVDSLDHCDLHAFHDIMAGVKDCLQRLPNVYFLFSSKPTPNIANWFEADKYLRSLSIVGHYA